MNETVTRLFSDTQPGPTIEDIGPTYIETARAIASICATRMLLMITVATGAAIWTWTVYLPTTDRLYAAIAFSVVFVLPQVLLYLKRG
jgi:multidrug resistance efflux pump